MELSTEVLKAFYKCSVIEKQPLGIFNVLENVQENQQQKVYF